MIVNLFFWREGYESTPPRYRLHHTRQEGIVHGSSRNSNDTIDPRPAHLSPVEWPVAGLRRPWSDRPPAAIADMFAYHDAGFTTWDLADHYGPAEDFIGEFRRRMAANRGVEALASIQAFTKWVPEPGRMTRQIVEENIQVSLRRMGVDTPRPAAVPLVGLRRCQLS